MSVSELEQVEPVHSEQRMAITSYACDRINLLGTGDVIQQKNLLNLALSEQERIVK